MVDTVDFCSISKQELAKLKTDSAQLTILIYLLSCAQGEIHPGWNREYFDVAWVRLLATRAKCGALSEKDM